MQPPACPCCCRSRRLAILRAHHPMQKSVRVLILSSFPGCLCLDPSRIRRVHGEKDHLPPFDRNVGHRVNDSILPLEVRRCNHAAGSRRRLVPAKQVNALEGISRFVRDAVLVLVTRLRPDRWRVHGPPQHGVASVEQSETRGAASAQQATESCTPVPPHRGAHQAMARSGAARA